MGVKLISHAGVSDEGQGLKALCAEDNDDYNQPRRRASSRGDEAGVARIMGVGVRWSLSQGETGS